MEENFTSSIWMFWLSYPHPVFSCSYFSSLKPVWISTLPKYEFGWMGTTEGLPEPCKISQHNWDLSVKCEPVVIYPVVMLCAVLCTAFPGFPNCASATKRLREFSDILQDILLHTVSSNPIRVYKGYFQNTVHHIYVMLIASMSQKCAKFYSDYL